MRSAGFWACSEWPSAALPPSSATNSGASINQIASDHPGVSSGYAGFRIASDQSAGTRLVSRLVARRDGSCESSYGYGLPLRLHWHHDRYTPDSCRLAAPRKSAESGQKRTLRMVSSLARRCTTITPTALRILSRALGCPDESDQGKQPSPHGAKPRSAIALAAIAGAGQFW